MSRRCTVCDHPDLEAIDKQLVESGNPYRSIAKRWRVSPAALFRHLENHVPAELVKARQAVEVARADRLLADVTTLRDRALVILDQTEASKEFRVALSAIREVRSCLELLARLSGELREQATVNVLVLPEWHRVRETVFSALFPYPEARAAVAEALRALPEAGGDGSGG